MSEKVDHEFVPWPDTTYALMQGKCGAFVPDGGGDYWRCGKPRSAPCHRSAHPQPNAQPAQPCVCGQPHCPECGEPAEVGAAFVQPPAPEIEPETEASISEWAHATFGPTGSNASVAARALKELAELIQKLTANDSHPGAAEELADVEIVLARLWVRLGANRQAEIDRKMATNRARKWRLTGDGHGQHV